MSNMDEFRPIPFYFLNTTVPEELNAGSADEGMRRLKDAGYGGCILFNKPPTGFDPELYLSDFWFKTIENFLVAARKYGLRIWINDGWDFPPGDAGRRIADSAPHLKQQRLTRTPDGKIVPADVPWGFPAFEEPESSRLFIQWVYEEYKKRLGKYFNNPMAGFFSDADNRRCMPGHLPSLDGKVYFPWSKDFSADFRARFGYDIEPFLPDILEGRAPDASADYWRLASDLYHRWFKNNYEWCKANGLKYSFHTSDTGPFTAKQCQRSSVFSEGEYLALASYCDYPGTDHELAMLDGGTHFDRRYFVPSVSRGGTIVPERFVNPAFRQTRWDVRAKYAAGVSYMHRRERTLCEAFAATNWGATPALLRQIGAWQILQGINFFVPHAVHHRLFGSTKFFAPPEFTKGSLRHAVREINDFFAKYCMIAALGEYAPNIAVIDPTPEIWRGGDGSKLFELCDRLNRAAYAYVITDRAHAASFPCALDPMADTLPELPPPEATFDSGELCWMIRTLADGSKCMLVSNLWSDSALRGTLSFGTRRIALELEPGEIAVIGGPYEEYRSPFRPEKTVPLEFPVPVTWDSPNRVPFHKNAGWTAAEALEKTAVQVPKALEGKVSLNGKILSGGKPVKVFDDVYVEYPVEIKAGEFTLDFPETEWETPIYLAGEFDAEAKVSGEFGRKVYEIYNLTLFEPECCEIRLRKRSGQLQASSWADQGHPFYSGAATYHFSLEGDGRDAVLCLPDVECVCEVSLDGNFLGRAVWAPYRFRLGKICGAHRLDIQVFNTLANQLEEYRAPGGLLSAPFLTWL
ncbi:MAG: hypothetical protein BWY31_00961 [Lentisphaerae bacterium ADurb.Bin242]|nr:MAG: hypothetical protein BWY31_00961 [Lentisphaerae bacterium ADurb.Bin242]